MLVALLVQGVHLVEEDRPAQCALEHLLGVLLRVGHVAAQQLGAAGLHHQRLAQHRQAAQLLAESPRHRRLAGPGRTQQQGVARRHRHRKAHLGARQVHLRRRLDEFDFPLGPLHAQHRVELGVTLGQVLRGLLGVASGLGLRPGRRAVRVPRIGARLNGFRVGQDQPIVRVVQRFAGRAELRIPRIHPAQQLGGLVLAAQVSQAHALGVEGDVGRARHPVTFDGVLAAPERLLEDAQRRQRRGGHRRARGLQFGLTPVLALGELMEHVRPPSGAEIQHAPHVVDQLLLEGLARFDAVQQLRRLLVAFRLGEDGGVGARQRLDAGDRQPQEQPVGDLRTELQIGDPEPAGLPAERPDRRPRTGEHLDALLTRQHPRQPGVAHAGVQGGRGGEHLRRNLRVVAGLQPVDRDTRCQQAGDHCVAGVFSG